MKNYYRNKKGKEMITELTKEQEAIFPEFVDKWLKIGHCTDSIDRAKAKEAINLCYTKAGLPEPREIIWCESPLSASLAISMFQNKYVGASVGTSVMDSVWTSVKNSVKNSVGSSVRDSVGASVGSPVWDSVRDSVGASVGASVWTSVWTSIRDSVWTSVKNSVGDSVWDSVRDFTKASVWDSVRDSVKGQHNAGWLAFYDYIGEVLGIDVSDLDGLIQAAQTCGWFFPYEKVCFVTERHNILKLNDRNVIHSETDRAIAYPDGFEIYARNGTVIPKEWIMNKESITPEIALTWENIEQRRVACEILGWHNILHHPSVNAKVIARSDQDYIGTLYEIDLPDAGKTRIVKAKCATGRTFGFLVPLESETPAEGLALTYGWTKDMPITPENFLPKLNT